MRRLLTILAPLALLVIGPLATFAQGGPAKLGALFNLTGGMAAIDLPGAKGAKLAVKLLNQNGGILKGQPLELIEFDTKTNLDATPKAAADLILKGVIAGLGYGDNDYALAAGAVFQKHGIPFMTSGATDPFIPQKVGPAMFMAAFGDDDQAYALASFAVNELKARRVAVWTNSSTDFTKGLAGFFKDRYRKLGGEIVLDEQYENEKADFTSLLQRLSALSPAPDAVFIAGVPQDALATVKSIRSLHKDVPILSGDGFDSGLVRVLGSADVAANIYFASHLFRGDPRPEVTAFVDAYRKEYGQSPEDSFAALAFDTVNVIAAAIERAGSTDPAALIRALAKTQGFKGVTGEIDLTRPRRVPLKSVTIVGIRDGTYHLAVTTKAYHE